MGSLKYLQLIEQICSTNENIDTFQLYNCKWQRLAFNIAINTTLLNSNFDIKHRQLYKCTYVQMLILSQRSRIYRAARLYFFHQKMICRKCKEMSLTGIHWNKSSGILLHYKFNMLHLSVKTFLIPPYMECKTKPAMEIHI